MPRTTGSLRANTAHSASPHHRRSCVKLDQQQETLLDVSPTSNYGSKAAATAASPLHRQTVPADTPSTERDRKPPREGGGGRRRTDIHQLIQSEAADVDVRSPTARAS
uniref:Uncharacterized protein n=1 Tax=Lotharella globosa TaxID=91324 RepID=A0A7S3Z281_9EUKA